MSVISEIKKIKCMKNRSIVMRMARDIELEGNKLKEFTITRSTIAQALDINRVANRLSCLTFV